MGQQLCGDHGVLLYGGKLRAVLYVQSCSSDFLSMDNKIFRYIKGDFLIAVCCTVYLQNWSGSMSTAEARVWRNSDRRDVLIARASLPDAGDIKEVRATFKFSAASTDSTVDNVARCHLKIGLQQSDALRG